MDDDFARFEQQSWQRVADKYESVWSSLLRLKTASNNTREETNSSYQWRPMWSSYRNGSGACETS